MSPSSSAPGGVGGPPEAELLLDRLLSASTPTDCLDSLDELQKLCKYRRPKPREDDTDPKNQRPSQRVEADAEREKARREAEDAEEERASQVVDVLLNSKSALHALCSLVASATLPTQINDGSSVGGGMEVEGGDVAACDLLLTALPSAPAASAAAGTASRAAGGATTEALQKQRKQKRRLEYISKTLLHFHENDGGDNAIGGTGGGALTPSLLDCLCGRTASVYARVLSLQLLRSLLAASPGTLREQLTTAPDGINRLVDLLGHGSDAGAGEGGSGDVPEEVRNEAILFLTSLASSSSMLARLVTFSEGYDRALKIAVESGASGGSTVAADCLDLCLALARADDVARELFLGGGDGRGNLDRLASLVDLRGGERFRDKERNLWWDRELKEKRKAKKRDGSKIKTDVAKKEEVEGQKQKQQSTKKGGRRGRQPKEDDLDDILRGASTATSAVTASKTEKDGAVDQSQQSKPVEPEGPPTPYLTPNESKIVDSAFELLLVLLLDGEYDDASSSQSARSMTNASRSKRRGRAKTITSHDLVRFVVDCALYTLPPPGVDYVSAVPPSKLQQKALVAMAVLGSLGDTLSLNDTKPSAEKEIDAVAAKKKKESEEESQLQIQLLFETMPIYLQGRVTAIDRLMYLCCTGAYSPKPSAEDGDLIEDDERPEVVASLLSTYSISAFRSCLPTETASRMVLHALAPPPPDEMGAPMEPPVVTRLVMTLADNLRFLQSLQREEGEEAAASDPTDIYRATIGASGSAGALGVFLTGGEGDATREMLLRLAPPPLPEGAENAQADHASEPANLIDFILQHVAMFDPGASERLDTSSFGELSDKIHASAAYVTTTLLRLLSEWVSGMPRAASEVLSSPSSVSVGVLVRSRKGGSSATGGQAAGAVPALSGLLLGLCLEQMADFDDSATGQSASAGGSPDTENVAWTRETIMDMIQSQGVGKYLSMMDAWRSRPLPLPYCPGAERSGKEKREFAGWYGKSVALVRRRVVATLAGSRGENDSDSDADDAGIAGADGGKQTSLRSLRKMVSSQAQEMEDLQSKLEEALSTTATQSTQIKELKRVTELGTSAETNDAIAEYTEKVAELEKTKVELKKEVQAKAKLKEDELAAKEGEIERIGNELRVAQESVEEMRRDNETLSEEMAGLSAAYNALEDQFHRSNSDGIAHNGSSSTDAAVTPTEMTAGGEAAFENGGARNPSSGGEAAAEDPSHSMTNNHEVQSLRDENERLRNDVSAANEWMTMAVGKMEEMSGENESLAHSLEEARSLAAAESSANAHSSAAIRGELETLREEARCARQEAEAARVNSEAEMKAKEEELAGQRVLVQQLEDRVEEMRISSSVSNNSSSANAHEVEEMKQASTRQAGELERLRQANKEAQEWIANAVSHVDMLTKQIQEKEEQLEQMASKLQTANERTRMNSNNESKIAGFEKSLSEMTSERDELQTSLASMKEEMTSLQEANEDLRREAEDSRAQDSSEKATIRAELDRAKAENATLTTNLREFQTWSETAQGRVAEVEAQLKVAVEVRDELRSQLEKITSEVGDRPKDGSQDDLKTLEQELRDKNAQLEAMQDQLIQDEEEHEAEAEKLRSDLESAKRTAVELTQQEREVSQTIDGLSHEKALLESMLLEKQVEVDAIAVGKADADAKLNEAKQRITELEEAKAAAECQFETRMALEDNGRDGLNVQLAAVIGEQDELRSQLEDMTQDCEEARKSLERTGVENCNLLARNRALEQDNKSLEYQYSEAKGKVQEKDNLLAVVNEEKSNLQVALDEIKVTGEEAIAQWDIRVKSLETDIESLEGQLEQQEKDAADAVAQWEARCSNLEGSGEGVVRQWEERVQSLEANIQSLESQLQQQEKDAAEAIAQWEARCSTLEETGGDVIQQWEDRVKSLEGDIESMGNQLEKQEEDAAEAIAQWEARCSTFEESRGDIIQQWEERVKLLEGEVVSLEDQLAEKEKEAAVAISQWEERVQSLEVDVQSLETQLDEKENEATEAIAQWEARCATLEESSGIIVQWEERVKSLEGEVVSLEDQLAKKENEATVVIAQWEERVQSLEMDIQSLETQLEEKENEATDAIAQWEARCATLEESSGNIVQWEERVKSLEGEVVSLKNQLAEKENEAAEAIAQWEARCSTLEEDGEVVIHQWETRVKSLEEEVASLENQLELREKESTDAISLWETKCLELEKSIRMTEAENENMSKQNQLLESSLSTASLQVEKLTKEVEEIQLQMQAKDDALASSDEQLSELANELVETQNQSEQVVKQWQERSDQLEANITELEDTIQEHENSANDAIAQWETRCTTLNEKIEVLELQLTTNDNDSMVADLKEDAMSLAAKLDASNADLEEAKELLALHSSEWKEKEEYLSSSIHDLKNRCSEQKKELDEGTSSLDNLKGRITVLEGENARLEENWKASLKESEDSQVLALELKDELMHAKEELQSFATDQFTVKATEMATQALRQQMVEIRSQYTGQQEALNIEREARHVAEEEVGRLKADLALLAQATEYNEDVDVYVRKMAQKVSAENVKNERKEMDELRSTLEQLREELGSCRWKERESEEKAANARLQMSILEQEVSAAKTDLAFMEQAMDELENSKIEMSVSLEYRIEAMENECLQGEQTYEDEIIGIKGELAQSNQERDDLAHKLEQSEKANAALVYSTSHDGRGVEESESEVIKLQLERAQLLAKISEMGADSTRRVKEAVAAQASFSEAELIVEKQSCKSVKSSLTDALSELEEVKAQLSEQASATLSSELAEKGRVVQDLEESLNEMRVVHDELVDKNKLLQDKLDSTTRDNDSAIDNLKKRLQKAEKRLRSEERESRFEQAIASEIANLREGANSGSNGNQKQSHSLVLRGIDENMRPGALFDESKESIDCNSAYIIEMYDYVVELKQSITEERQLYKDLLAEHEDLLALLGQAGLDGIQISTSSIAVTKPP